MPPALEKPLCSSGVRFNQEMFVLRKTAAESRAYRGLTRQWRLLLQLLPGPRPPAPAHPSR
jgi:hypothetical protein